MLKKAVQSVAIELGLWSSVAVMLYHILIGNPFVSFVSIRKYIKGFPLQRKICKLELAGKTVEEVCKELDINIFEYFGWI